MNPRPAPRRSSTHVRRTYDLCLRFFAELAGLGVTQVVVSPGSRSTPLTVAASRVAGLTLTVVHDERVAGFIALGVGKSTGVPAVLVCTSGTALANHLPSVVEANHAGLPMIVCSGDRPPELRRWGAGQTIDQPDLFAGNVRWRAELPVASEVDDDLLARGVAVRAFDQAVRGAGPVHLNWPFRKPLDPDAESVAPPSSTVSRTEEIAPASPVLAAAARDHRRGLVVVGPNDLDVTTLDEIAAFATAHGWPIVADPASGLRHRSSLAGAPIVTAADLFVGSAWFSTIDPPEVVVRIGCAPTSAALTRWLDDHRPARSIIVAPGTDWPDPSHGVTEVVAGQVRGMFASVGPGHGVGEWARRWLDADAHAAGVAHGVVARDTGELAAVAAVLEGVEVGGAPVEMMVSSSMPIRLVDALLRSSDTAVRVRANRGANGIDGVVATALGLAIGAGRPAVALIGDVAAVHDLGGLAAAAREDASVTVVVVDNDGGGIFAMLPVKGAVDAETFDRYFTTPHGTDIVAVADALGWDAESVEVDELAIAVEDAIDAGGPHLIRVEVPGGGAAAAALAELRRQVASALADGRR